MQDFAIDGFHWTYVYGYTQEVESPFLVVYLCLSFGCAESLLLGGLCSRCGGEQLLSSCAGFSLRWFLLLWSTGSRSLGSVVAACGLQSTGSGVVWYVLSCSEACGLFPGQGLNSYLLHWQVDSLPLNHQGSPAFLAQLRSVVLNKVLATSKELSSSTPTSSIH